MDAFPRIGYAGVGAYLPRTVLTNDQIAEFVDTSDAWIQRRTGICTRRILDRDESILDMAVEAARRALDDAGIAASEIDDIRVGVNTWFRFPSLATQIQRVLGCPRAAASDVSAGCAGFIYAVEEAYNKLLTEKLRYGRDLTALVLGVDGLSHITDWTDRNTCVLLGDGAGAVVLKEVESGGILAIHTRAQGEYGHLLHSPHVLESQMVSNGTMLFTNKAEGQRSYLKVDGPKVYPIAIDTMVKDARTVIEKYNGTVEDPITLEDIHYVYPHQANLRIIEQVARKLGVPLEKVYTDGIVNYGNTSTASIPIGYSDNAGRARNEDDLEIDVAFGAGFASGAILRRVGCKGARRESPQRSSGSP
ncbi:MAG: beta-ketoacyl-ACP synthase 3 [Planctomycetota bacterium]